MLLPLSWIKEYVDIDVSISDIREKLTMSGFEVEDVKEEDGDFIFQVKVVSNRGDCLSVLGIARELCAIYEKKIKLPSIKNKPSGKIINIVEIKEPSLCMRYSGKLIKNVRVGVSPSWMQERLVKCGIRPINNIVDITNYVCMEIGQPLHAFDYDTLKGEKIIVRCAISGEEILTLDEKKRVLSSGMLVIADEKRPVAVAGVIGGKETEITDTTKNIFLESAHFKPESIRKTSKDLGVSTASSYRFERWVDPSFTMFALSRAVDLTLDIAGGEIDGEVDILTDEIVEKKIEFNPHRCYFIMGENIGEKKIKNIFERLQFKVEEKDGIMDVTVPTFRKDILQEEDLIEEVCRIYGYNNISTSLPLLPLSPGRDICGSTEDKIRNFFVYSGFSEVITHSLVNDMDEKLTVLFDICPENIVSLRNPRIPDVKFLRTSIVPSLLDTLKYNISQQNYNISIFELGKIYLRKDEDFNEIKVLSFLLYGDVGKNMWTEKRLKIPSDYFYLKGIVEKLFEIVGVLNFEFCTEEHPLFHPLVCARVTVDGKKVGVFGKINPEVLKKWDIVQDVFCAEFNISEISKHTGAELKYTPLSYFPAVLRDISIVVSKDIPYKEIVKTIKEVDIDILENVELFDEYTGEQIPHGKKSLALSLTFRKKDGTLSSDEVNNLQNKILKKLKEVYNISIREE